MRFSKIVIGIPKEIRSREIRQPRPPGLKRGDGRLKLLEPLLDHPVICAGQQFG